MSMFSQGRYPRRWGEMSLDMKLMFAFHGAMMALFIAAGALSAPIKLVIAGGMLIGLATISTINRRRSGWRWAGIGPMQALQAAGAIIVILVLCYAATPQFPPTRTEFLPWYLAAGGIGLFNVLQCLRLVRASQVDFLADCGHAGALAEIDAARSTLSRWKTIVATVYGIAFFAIWLDFLAFFYAYGVSVRDGSSVPTGGQTQQIVDHGQVVFIAANQKALVDGLESVAMIGMPVVILFGFVLAFALKIPVFGDRAPWSKR
jgi:hypothetical protein